MSNRTTKNLLFPFASFLPFSLCHRFLDAERLASQQPRYRRYYYSSLRLSFFYALHLEAQELAFFSPPSSSFPFELKTLRCSPPETRTLISTDSKRKRREVCAPTVPLSFNFSLHTGLAYTRSHFFTIFIQIYTIGCSRTHTLSLSIYLSLSAAANVHSCQCLPRSD